MGVKSLQWRVFKVFCVFKLNNKWHWKLTCDTILLQCFGSAVFMVSHLFTIVSEICKIDEQKRWYLNDVI